MCSVGNSPFCMESSSLLAWDLKTFEPAPFNELDSQEDELLQSYISAVNPADEDTSKTLVIIPQWHSRGPLMITAKVLAALTSKLGVFPGFQSVLDSFIPDGSDCYVDRPGAYFNPRSQPASLLQRFESCCLLKYVEMNSREQSSRSSDGLKSQNQLLQWSVRQQGVYLLHEVEEHRVHNYTVLINPSDELWNSINEEYDNSEKDQEEAEWTVMPMVVFKSLTANWVSYITCLHNAVQNIGRDAEATDPRRPNIGEANTQSLKAAVSIMSRLQTAAQVLGSNVATIRAFGQQLELRKAMWKDTRQLQEKDGLLDCIDGVVRELEFRRSHITTIMAKLESVTAMVRDLVNLRNTHTMETLTVKTVSEAHTMRVVALLTLFFLPPTFIAGFLDMDYIDIKSEKGLIRLKFEPGLWLYLGISLPLVIVIMASYLIWDRRNVRRARRNESLV